MMRMSIRFSVAVVAVAFVAALSAAPVFAVAAAPGWTLDSFPAPTHFSTAAGSECGFSYEGEQEKCESYEVFATNAGTKPTVGAVTLTDTPPAAVTVQKVLLYLVENGNALNSHAGHGGTTVALGECESAPVRCVFEGFTQNHVFSGSVPPDDALLMKVFVNVNQPENVGEQLTNEATVSGGGAATVKTTSVNEVNPAAAGFGPAVFDFFKAGVSGGQESQAGGHPYELTTTIDLDNAIQPTPEDDTEATSVEPVKDIVVDLPLGFAGSTLAAPECTEAQLASQSGCPPDTIVGHLTTDPADAATAVNNPVYNMVPEYGHPADFGYIDGAINTTHIAGYVSVVPTPEGYVLRFVASEIPEITLRRISLTLYGDPALKDAETGQQEQERELKKPVPLEVPVLQLPFFTNPTACSDGPQVARIWMDSWLHPARFEPGDLIPSDLDEEAWKQGSSESPAVTGCNLLSFTPELGAQPTTHEADKPSGLEFGLRLPQTANVDLAATPALRDVRVTFPEGMTVDPSSADGLGVCTDAQVGWTGPTLFDFTEGKPECPESSKIGELELESPDIPGVLHGEMFLAAQNENPFGSTFATWVVVNDPVTGIVLKIAGELKQNPATGQITSVFNENPQLPFSSLKLHFFGGPRASLATPSNCGVYTTSSVMEPWSFETSTSDTFATPSDSYAIDEDCQTTFHPSYTAGSTNLAAGAYSTFEASFERQDNEPELGGLSVSLPPGLLADVGSVPECSEAQVHETEASGVERCPQDTQVGSTEAGAGPGPDPLFVPGKIYLTGPYNGGPYGLVVVVPADPGPFNFGLVVVRQSLRINPETAAVTDVSDPFPTILDPRSPNGNVNGIPIKLRRVDVQIDRPGFVFNPTNCGHMQVGGAITSLHGESSSFATPFQVTNCAHLKFQPVFSVSAAPAKDTRLDGASLTAKLSYPSVPQGTETNIARVKVELPKQLPSRLTTLRKACTAQQFDANPAGCPAASKIGQAIVHTPILAGALTGPAIFVSHGGEAFPSLTIVLQGDGVTVDLVGTTFISKAGVTSTTFKTVPDTPFSTFELTLPTGEYSALTALGNLCKQKLTMPTEFIAQNGAEIHQATKVTASGCPKMKAKKGAKRKGRRSRHGARRKAAGAR